MSDEHRDALCFCSAYECILHGNEEEGRRAVTELFRFLYHPDGNLREKACILIACYHPLLILETFGSQAPESRSSCRQKAFFPDREDFFRTCIDGALTEIGNHAGRFSTFLKSLLYFSGYAEEIMDVFHALNRNDCHSRFAELRKEKSMYRYRKQLMIALTYACNLHCDYCYARNRQGRYPNSISMDDFNRVLDWCAGQDVEFISFTGGEPTESDRFQEIIACLTGRPFKCYFATNNLFSGSIADALIQSDSVRNITIHINDITFYTGAQLQRFYDNLKVCRDGGLSLHFRYNILDEDTGKWGFIFDTAEATGITQITFSLPFPNENRSNRHIASTELKTFNTTVMEFVRKSYAHDIRATFAKPLPLCMFCQDEIKELVFYQTLIPVCTIQRNDYTYNLIVNPDLSVNPCIALDWKSPKRIIDYPSFEAVGAYYRPLIEAVQSRLLFPECKACDLHTDKKCQGACLAYKLKPSENEWIADAESADSVYVQE